MSEQPRIRPLGEPGDLAWVIAAHGEMYTREHDWDSSFEQLVASIVGDFAAAHDPARERGWIAELDGERVGCVFCTAVDEHVAQLRLLLVDARARGAGLGRRLVDTCVEFARTSGYGTMRLWTNATLTPAIGIYRACGFELTHEHTERRFGVDFPSQTYELAL